jgi:hypothetical protein
MSLADGQSSDLFEDYTKIRNHLETRLEEMMRSRFLRFRNYVLLLQSSGYGKTRLCMKLMETIRGVFLLCASIQGGFNMSPLITRLQEEFRDAADDNNGKLACVVKFLGRVQAFAKAAKSPMDLFAQQFDREARVYRATFTDPENLLVRSPDRNETLNLTNLVAKDSSRPISAIGFGAEIDSASGVTSSSFATEHPAPDEVSDSSSTHDWVLVIFDEAHKLGEALIAKLKAALDRFHMIGIFLTTCGHIHELLPLTVSHRGSGRVTGDPVCCLRSTDLYQGHKLTLGRPLWHHYLTSRCIGLEHPYNDLVMYAMTRLSGKAEENESEHARISRETSFKLSLFMCRFGGLYPASHVVSSDFVARHMATYIRIDAKAVGGNKQITCSVTYPSEPVLVEASALCTSSFVADGMNEDIRCSKEEVLTTVTERILKSDVVKLDRGDLGEVFACALIGYHLDLIRERYIRDTYNAQSETSSMRYPVSVKEFLCTLYPPVADTNVASLLEDYVLNTTHFVRLPFKTSYSACAEAIKRGAGIITYENSRALDFYMEAYRPGQQAPQETTIQAAQYNHEDEVDEDDDGPVLVGSYDSKNVYEDENKRFFYFAGAKRRYLHQADYGSVLKSDAAVLADAKCPQLKDIRLDNLHIRVSAKNCSVNVSRTQARNWLDAVDTECEPVNALGSGNADSLRVTILINVGKGLLDPFVEVSQPRKTRGKPGKEGQLHLMIALGLNHSGNVEHSPFTLFSQRCLELFRDAARGTKFADDEVAMSLGNDLYGLIPGTVQEKKK